MWTTIERARRRLVGGNESGEPAPDRAFTAGSRDELSLTLGRADLDRLVGVLEGVAGTNAGRPDTPARIEAGLRLIIANADGSGRPTVLRRPPGLYTPEAWEVLVEDADERARAAIDDAIRDPELGR